MAEESLVLPGEWEVGDVVTIERGGDLVVRGRITGVVGSGVYKITVLAGGIQAHRGRGVSDSGR